MRAVRTLLLVVLGIAIPAAIVSGVYFASAGSLADVPAVVAVPANKVAAPIPIASTTTTANDDHRGKNGRPGKCDEKEHELDPECDPPRRKHRSESSGSGGSGGSGSGSSSSSSSGSSAGSSGGSGSGSGGGGSGGGDDDESEHGDSGHDD
jgi:hypothetical protein